MISQTKEIFTNTNSKRYLKQKR